MSKYTNCDCCPELFLGDEANMVRVVDYGQICQVCYELLKVIRGNPYWLAVQAKWHLNPYKLGCDCTACQPKATKPYLPNNSGDAA